MEGERMKINFKKGATIRDTAMILILVIFGFVAIFNFVSQNAAENNIQLEPKYNQTQQDLISNQNKLSNLSTTIRNLIPGVDEAEGDNPGYFGLRGVLALMIAPLTIIDIALETSYIFLGFNEYLPPFVKDLITIALTIIISFTIITFITQRGKDST